MRQNMQDFKQLAVKRLSKTALFETLNKKELEKLIEDSRTIFKSFNKSEKIYDPINYNKSLAYVLKGSGSVLLPNGKNKGYLMKNIKENEFFGVASLFNSKDKYVSEIKADKDMIIVFFKEELIKELIETNKRFALSYIEFLSDRINYLNSKINMLVGDNNKSKLVEYLFNQCSEDNNIIKISMSKLSKSLNMGRSSLYREMDELEELGIIKRLGNKEYLVDYDSLFKYRI